MTQYVQEKVENLERPIIAWALLGIIVTLVFMYAYFVNGAIANIVSTKDMQAKISATESAVSALESSYLAAKSALTLDYALALGFSESKSDTVYISKKALGSLTLNR